MVTVLDDYTDRSGPLRVLWPSSRHLAPKLRVFVEFLAANLVPAVEREADSEISSSERSISIFPRPAAAYRCATLHQAARRLTRLYDDLAGVVARDVGNLVQADATSGTFMFTLPRETSCGSGSMCDVAAGHDAVEWGDDPLIGLLLAPYQQLGLCAWMAIINLLCLLLSGIIHAIGLALLLGGPALPHQNRVAAPSEPGPKRDDERI